MATERTMHANRDSVWQKMKKAPSTT